MKQFKFWSTLLLPPVFLVLMLGFGPWLNGVRIPFFPTDPLMRLHLLTILAMIVFFIRRPAHFLVPVAGFALTMPVAALYSLATGEPAPLRAAWMLFLVYGLPWVIITLFIAFPSLKKGAKKPD